ncbi:MAG: 2,3-bisphosphoglycerate-independent phosphoglycerate mutase [Elusimicrobia bacterium]|nr:2,3-bisphosphoglycerate-independent phosphoglycerate mutase [Elusimicrobiota bacterium]
MIGEKELVKLVKSSDTKIVLIVMDGVGDIPDKSGKTALEQAKTPNMDKLAAEGNLGFTLPIDWGITPGSGPSHLALFGYDPLEHEIGRGVLEALGIGLKLGPNDLAARANFATRDDKGIITDRRAGRISSEVNQKLCEKLSRNLEAIDGVTVKVYPGKEHRFVAVFSGEGLYDNLMDADPEETGKMEKFVEALDEKSARSADIANKFIKEVQQVLKDDHPANTCLLRGLAKAPGITGFGDLFGLRACAIASYPMYKGLSRLVGMEVIEGLNTLEDEVEELKKQYNNYDFFYLHVKKTDSYGEDGNRPSKVKTIEEFDKLVPGITGLKPDVICITSDHSTPTDIKGHSWHPNPILIKGPHMRKDGACAFDESECLKGAYGTMFSKDVMQILMAQAGRLKKFGA